MHTHAHHTKAVFQYFSWLAISHPLEISGPLYHSALKRLHDSNNKLRFSVFTQSAAFLPTLTNILWRQIRLSSTLLPGEPGSKASTISQLRRGQCISWQCPPLVRLKNRMVLSAYPGEAAWVPYVHIVSSKDSLNGLPRAEGTWRREFRSNGGGLDGEEFNSKVGSLGKHLLQMETSCFLSLCAPLSFLPLLLPSFYLLRGVYFNMR